MDEKDFPTSSDEADEDFVPEGEPSSEEGSSSVHSEDISDEDKGHKSRKRRKLSKKKKKSTKVEDKNVTEEDKDKGGKVIDVDALWADFKEDVKKMEERILSHQPMVDEKPKPDLPIEKPKPDSSDEKPAASKEEPVSTGSGNKSDLPMKKGKKLGLAKVLEQLAKKDKMSTLAKSKRDWFNFTKSEGIDEEIKRHNKGKGGYLEKQDFLQRTDLRQFEIEKKLRASKRDQ